MSQPRRPLLVVDTNVAVKAYLEEEFNEEALVVLDAGNYGGADLIAPSHMLPEFWNALSKRNRRDELSLDEAQRIWESFNDYPVTLYELAPIADRAVEIAKDTGCTVYDALFVALADDEQAEDAVLVTDDRKLLRKLDGSSFAGHARHLSRIYELVER